MVLFCLKVMPVAKRKYFDFLKSNKQVGALQPKVNLVNQTGILFVYLCLWTLKYTHLQGFFPFGFLSNAVSVLCRMTLML